MPQAVPVPASRVVRTDEVARVVNGLRADGFLVALWPVHLPGDAATGPPPAPGPGVDLTVVLAPGDTGDGPAGAAADAGGSVTFAAGPGTSVDALLAVRRGHPGSGVALSARLARTPADLVREAGPVARLRLVRRPPPTPHPDDGAVVAPADAADAFRHCVQVLLAGPGTASVAVGDPGLADLAAACAETAHRPPTSWELLMPYAVRPEEHARQRAAGRQVRVLVPVAVSGSWA